MDLCNICQAIPFTSLPTIPKDLTDLGGGLRNVAEEGMPYLTWFSTSSNKWVQPQDTIGIAWHDSVQALSKSAVSGCPLCKLLYHGVQSWLGKHGGSRREYGDILRSERLWLNKRVGGADGFIVLIPDPKDRTYVYLLTGVSFSIEANGILASTFSLRPVEVNSGSRNSLDVAVSFLSNCIERHEICAKEDSALPTRVLDVGTSGESIRLIESLGGSSHKYIALSHCWGSSRPLTTTHQSLQKHIRGISLSQLPKTFLDAVIIARHFNIRYLWIDSLCIIQDDQDDWAHESSRMRDVYANAYLVISANHAKNGSEGCFHDRPHRPGAKIKLPGLGEVCAQLIYPEDELPEEGSNFDQEPLSERGWTLQERVLARRVLHYNTKQMYFECNRNVRGEDGYKSARWYCCNPNYIYDSYYMEIHKIEAARKMWYMLFETYGKRKLTKATDKLPAMSGIARSLQEQIGAEYVAGLWSDRLVEELAWSTEGSDNAHSSALEYTGPSWSWSGFDGTAVIGQRKTWKDIAKVEDWHAELKNDSNPFGEVKDAWIRIHAPVAEIAQEDWREDFLDDSNIRASGVWWEWKMQVLILGGLERVGEFDKDTTIQGDPEVENLPIPWFDCLVITPAGDSPNSKMKRIGFWHLKKEYIVDGYDLQFRWQTVTLI